MESSAWSVPWILQCSWSSVRVSGRRWPQVLELRIGQKPTVVVTSRPDDEPPPGCAARCHHQFTLPLPCSDRPADQEPGEEKDPADRKSLKATRKSFERRTCKDEKDLKAERRAKQKAATRFQAQPRFAREQFRTSPIMS